MTAGTPRRRPTVRPPVTLLVLAKAPVPGWAKTRLAATVGQRAAADLAAAALLDTLDAVTAAADRIGGRVVVALAGEVAHGARAGELAAALDRGRVVAQRGGGLAARIVAAHLDAAPEGGPVLQVGMDTPQVDADLLVGCAGRLEGVDAVLGPAEDGGWWLLGVRRAVLAGAVAGVAMSTARTGVLTLAALRAAGARVRLVPTLRDVDVRADARAVAALAPTTRFARTLAAGNGLRPAAVVVGCGTGAR